MRPSMLILAAVAAPAAAELQHVNCGTRAYNHAGGREAKQGKVVECVAYGKWRDITDQVTVRGSGVLVSIAQKTGGSLPVIRLRVDVSGAAPVGTRTIKMSRPAFGGRDSDSFFFKVLAQ